MTTKTNPSESESTVHYNTIRIGDIDLFYREAGAKDAPVLLLLHGFPTSSNMFRNLIPRLAGSFRIIAPDYPGYGFSSMPDRKSFAYTFENMTNLVEELTNKLGLNKYAMYVMDYGAPIGYRLAIRHPEKVSGLIVQNGKRLRRGAPRVLGSDQEILGRGDSRQSRSIGVPDQARRDQVAVRKWRFGQDPGRSDDLHSRSGRAGSPWEC